MSSAGLAEQVMAGDARALARALSLVEDRVPAAEGLLRALFPRTGRARVVGLTGPAGSGKSTLADRLAATARARGESVGIVAVDPTSPFSGGAILGDRIRMQQHYADGGVFIRSLATRGAMGGLAEAAGDVLTVLDAAGRQRLLLETVGVGQDEVDVVRLADVTVVVLVPGLGDDVQALKAGLMEIADVFALNKADRGAERLEQEVKAALSLAPAEEWRPLIVRTVAATGEGVDGLEAAIAKRLEWMEANGGLAAFRRKQWEHRLSRLAQQRMATRWLAPVLSPARLEELATEVAERRRDPYAAVDAVLGEAAGAMTPAGRYTG